MLSNAYFLAKFRFDTAENEPAKNLQNFANFPNSRPQLQSLQPAQADFRAGARRDAGLGSASQRASVGKISAKCCSFSAVSAPIFARKYAFFSIFQNLPDYLAEIFEIWQNFADFATFAKCLLNFHKNC